MGARARHGPCVSWRRRAAGGLRGRSCGARPKRVRRARRHGACADVRGGVRAGARWDARLAGGSVSGKLGRTASARAPAAARAPPRAWPQLSLSENAARAVARRGAGGGRADALVPAGARARGGVVAADRQLAAGERGHRRRDQVRARVRVAGILEQPRAEAGPRAAGERVARRRRGCRRSAPSLPRRASRAAAAMPWISAPRGRRA